jgi:AIR synthase related protein, N-terminal domain/Transposase DDE domain
MGGQIVDASAVAAPKPRNTENEKRALKEGRIPEAWTQKPALAQKDRDARWTVKYSKAKPSADGARRVDIAIPMFGYRNHVGIDRRHGLIRTWTATDAARHDGAQLPALLDRVNTGSGVWADTAYRSAKNESRLEAPRLQEPHPPQEAAGQADAEACLPRQRREVRGPGPCRACLRPPEGIHGAGDPHHRPRPGKGEDRPREACLQPAPHGPAGKSSRRGVTMSHGNGGMENSAEPSAANRATSTSRPQSHLRAGAAIRVLGGVRLAPSVLQQLLADQPAAAPFAQLLVGTETGDDTAVWQLDAQTCWIPTTDFFMPMVDDPRDFWRIAATNAISDVYAMGGA